MTVCVLHQTADCATCGLNRVRAALAIAPRTQPAPDDTTTHGRALARARTERTNAKETQP